MMPGLAAQSTTREAPCVAFSRRRSRSASVGETHEQSLNEDRYTLPVPSYFHVNGASYAGPLRNVHRWIPVPSELSCRVPPVHAGFRSDSGRVSRSTYSPARRRVPSARFGAPPQLLNARIVAVRPDSPDLAPTAHIGMAGSHSNRTKG